MTRQAAVGVERERVTSRLGRWTPWVLSVFVSAALCGLSPAEEDEEPMPATWADGPLVPQSSDLEITDFAVAPGEGYALFVIRSHPPTGKAVAVLGQRFRLKDPDQIYSYAGVVQDETGDPLMFSRRVWWDASGKQFTILADTGNVTSLYCLSPAPEGRPQEAGEVFATTSAALGWETWSSVRSIGENHFITLQGCMEFFLSGPDVVISCTDGSRWGKPAPVYVGPGRVVGLAEPDFAPFLFTTEVCEGVPCTVQHEIMRCESRSAVRGVGVYHDFTVRYIDEVNGLLFGCIGVPETSTAYRALPLRGTPSPAAEGTWDLTEPPLSCAGIVDATGTKLLATFWSNTGIVARWFWQQDGVQQSELALGFLARPEFAVDPVARRVLVVIRAEDGTACGVLSLSPDYRGWSRVFDVRIPEVAAVKALLG